MQPPTAAASSSRRALVFCLLGAILCDYADRNVLGLLLQPIGDSLNLSYLQLGSLSSALLVFYIIASAPIAVAVERTADRSRMLAGAVAAWSVFAALSGAAQSYWQLLFCRIMVGIGEATVAPVAQTLISDTFSPSERTGALGIYLSGIPLGNVVGYGLGAAVSHFAATWRWVFVAVAAPGLPVAAACALCIADPRGGVAPTTTTAAASDAPASAWRHFGSSLGALWSVRGSGWLAAWRGISSVGAGAYAFTSPFLTARFGMSTEEVGAFSAFGLGLFPWGCTIAGGLIIDQLVKRSGTTKPMIYVSVALALPSLAVATVAILTRRRILSLILFVLFNGIEAATGAGISSLVQTSAPRGSRAVAITLFLFVGFGGTAIGTPMIGALADGLEPSLGRADALSRAMLLVFATAKAVGFVLLWVTARVIDYVPATPTSGDGERFLI